MHKVLITGLHSFIGQTLTHHLSRFPEEFSVSAISLRNPSWQSESFRGFTTVFHAAGIAHDSTRSADKDSYFRINSQLAFDTARKAKHDGVSQFIFMSSSIVYGSSAPIGHTKLITRSTPLNPATYYGQSKVRAEELLNSLNDDDFRICILRCPMIYGKGCKGNYRLLSKIARTLPVFPRVQNCRSMLYSENLAKFVRLIIQNHEQGIFWPQNSEYTNTSEMVRMIADVHGKRIFLTGGCEWLLRGLAKVTGLVNKAFGSLAYDMSLSEYPQNYRLYTLRESISRTELQP
ncbi:MAG: NAD-dependent epimerase/dehydratase family protein [Synergistaceae bacterium]|nr:NAD-dependent epimerase/dehydratase family protein [Synergistaceae bacterium]